ncbi:uncharacterized protein [Palaemon carinicauda]|uniref:uncharacterized protein n=1 Tax=Palaemon carinicauda TaxID=392227 RepID=UPI0035B63B92
MVVPETLQDSSRNRVSFDIKVKGPIEKEKNVLNRTTNEPSDVPEKPVKSRKGRSKKQTNEQSGEGNGKTPYQGNRHTCGAYRCDSCARDWFSANSWADCYQLCNGCNQEIYPYKQFTPKKSKSRKKKDKSHPEAKCQKCMELGYLCVPVSSSPKKGKRGKRRKGKKSPERDLEILMKYTRGIGAKILQWQCENETNLYRDKITLDTMEIFIAQKVITEKAFDSVRTSAVMKALQKQGIKESYVRTLEDIYTGSTAILKLHKDSDKIPIVKEVKRGKAISHKLFTTFLDDVFEKLDWENVGININGEYLNNLRFADETHHNIPYMVPIVGLPLSLHLTVYHLMYGVMKKHHPFYTTFSIEHNMAYFACFSKMEMVVPVEIPKDNLEPNAAPSVEPEERGTMMHKSANTLKQQNAPNVQKENQNAPNVQKKNQNAPNVQKKKQNANETTKGSKMKGLTPYQGSRRACGMFYCEKCKKGWFSANSWADCYQNCKGCNGEIYPYAQFPPEVSGGARRNVPPHPQDMCQKCKQLRRSCVNLYQSDVFPEREE